MTSKSYSIIIATKDREESLSRTLDSLMHLTILPTEIVLCSSGRDIRFLVDSYRTSFTITHVISEIQSQVHQKKLAIANISKKVSWVVFLDDDVILNQDTIEKAFLCLGQDPKKESVAGIGFSIEDADSSEQGRLAKIYSNKLGRVLKSGHNVGYIKSRYPIHTQWLNGVSMWKYSTLSKYDNELDTLSRSLGEDLIFSYGVSRSNKLLFCPDAKIRFQNPQSQQPTIRGEELKLYFFVTLYFVLKNKELSLLRFFVFQMLRFLYSVSTVRTESRVCVREFFEFLIIYTSSLRVFFVKNKLLFVMKKLAL